MYIKKYEVTTTKWWHVCSRGWQPTVISVTTIQFGVIFIENRLSRTCFGMTNCL